MKEEKVYYVDTVNRIDEIGEYVENYVFKNKKKFNKEKIFTIKIGKIKFAIFVVKNSELNKKIILLKTKKALDYGIVKINDLKEEFNTDLCFIVFKSPQEKYENLVEELLENIIKNMEVYVEIQDEKKNLVF